MSVSIKTPADIEGMRRAGRMTAEILDYIGPFVKPGVTTDELDALCHRFMLDVQKGIAANVNYTPRAIRHFRSRSAHQSITSSATVFQATRS